MSKVKGEWCQWHVLIVEGSDTDDREVDVLHPGCPFTFTSDPGGGSWEHHCAIEWEILNAGFDTLLNDNPGDGWFRARMRHVEQRGFDWTEIDTEYEVEQLVVRHPVSLDSGDGA